MNPAAEPIRPPGLFQAPAQPRCPLWWGGEVVGSVDPQWVQRLLGQPLAPLMQPKSEHVPLDGYALDPDFFQHIHAWALALHQAGLTGPWRGESVPVTRSDGRVWARLERALVRVLGLRTQALHLMLWTPERRCWVQQRSLSKPNDPGLWDTLMGGTVSGSETLVDTLVRETWEEAGLRLRDLQHIRHRGRFTAARPTPDADGAGYLLEDTHWFTATAPDGCVPVNQDGEVDHFECWSPQQVQAAVAAGRFTPEAAWVLTQALTGTTP